MQASSLHRAHSSQTSELAHVYLSNYQRCMQAADAALGEAGPGGPAAAGMAAAAEPDETSLPDTGLRSHSLACLLHWQVALSCLMLTLLSSGPKLAEAGI